MTEAVRVIGASAEQIFEVLADGWTYASWVVGAAHMRDVDPSWPAVGSRLYHRVGPWPFNIDDRTVVCDMVPNRLVDLDARVWPVGSARVKVTLEPLADGRTRVHMHEALSSPIGRRVPDRLQALLLVPRNRESLARLDDIVVHRVARK